MFVDFMHKNFKEAFEKRNNPNDKLFVQDGDPSKSSRKTNNGAGAKKSSMPAQSSNISHIENVFNYVSAKLHEESLNRKINFTNFEEYSVSVKKIYYQQEINI